MAINRNTTFNPSDMNFMDKDFGNSDMDNQGKGRVRKAIKLIFAPMKGLAKGFVDKALEENLSNLEDAKDLAGSFASAFGEEYGKFKKDAKELGSSMKELMPNSIRSKFKGAFEDESPSSPGDSAANEISSAMTSIFSRTTSQQASMTSAMMKSAAADRAVSHAYMKLNADVLSSVNQSTASIDYFLKNIYTKYLEKDIELKYRSLHAVSEIKAHIDHVAGAFKENGLMSEILANVKLPDSEKAAAAYRDKKSTKTGTSQYAAGLPKNIAESIFSLPSMITSMAQMAVQSVAGMDMNAESILEGVGKFAAKNLIKKEDLPEPIKKLLENKKVKNFGQKVKERAGILNDDLGFGVKNFSTLINSLGKKLSGSDNFLVSMLGGMIPQFNRDTSSKNKAAAEPEGPATFDNITRESIVSVIPRHLERIGDHIEALAKAMGAKPPDDNTKQTYDVTTRSLISVSKQKEKTADFIYGNAEKRKAREEDTLSVITNNLRANDADGSIWSAFNNKDVQKAITTFFNHSGDKHQDIDIAALVDFINNGTGDFNTQQYIEEVFGKTDKKVAQTAARIIYSSILATGADGKQYVSNALRRSITNRITDLGKEVDEIEERRSLKEQQGVYNQDDYDFDEYGTATPKDDKRYAGMQGEASNSFAKDAFHDDMSRDAKSIKGKMERYNNIRSALPEGQRNLADKMASSGFDSGIIGLGSFTDKAVGKVKGWGEALQNKIPFLKKYDLVGKATTLFGKIRNRVTNYDNTIFVVKLRLLNKNEGKFYVGYKKKGENGACNVTLKLGNLNIDDAKLELDGPGKFKPNDVLKKIEGLLIDAIKSDSTLKEQKVVDKDTTVVCAYTRNYWVEGVYSQAQAEAENDPDIEEAEKAENSTKSKIESAKNQKPDIDGTDKKSPLELIQEDVRALRVKFVGKPKAEKSKKSVEKEQQKTEDVVSDDFARTPEQYPLVPYEGPAGGKPEEGMEEEAKHGKMYYALGTAYNWAKGGYDWAKDKFNRAKNFLGFGGGENKEGQPGGEPKKTLLGKLFGAISGVFGLFKKKSATAAEWAQSALKAGVSKGEAIMIGLLGMFTKKQNEKDKKGGEDKDDEGGGLLDTAMDIVDNVKGLKNLTKSAKVFKHAKFLRNHPKLLKLAKFAKHSKLLAKLPGVGGNALLAPLAAGLAGAGAGFLGSKSSGASTGSGIFSALTGAGAGSLLAANIWNPVGWAMAAGMGANAMREGWNDKKTLQKSWGGEQATDSQKGASAVGNIANYLTFGLLNKTGGRKYVDKLVDNTNLGSFVGGIGGQIAGIGDLFRASKRADQGNSAPMTDLELKRARAKLQTDIKRGDDPEARKKLADFEKAVKAGDWYGARQISGVTVNTSRERTDALKRIGKGMLNTMTLGYADKLMGSDQNAPMSQKEVQEATKNLQDYAKRHPETGRRLVLDFEEAVAGERWAIARKISGKKNMSLFEKQLGVSVGKYAAIQIATLGLGALFMKNENKPMSDKEVKAFQDKCMKLIQGGNQGVQQILDRFNDAVQLGNWKIARKIAGKETTSAFQKLAKVGGVLFRNTSILGMWFSNQDAPMSQKDIDNFHKKMQFRIEKGYPGAREQLDRFDNAVLTNNWKLARAISNNKATSLGSKLVKGVASLYWGFADKPLTEAEIEKFRASMKRKIDLGDNTARKILDQFDEAVGNQYWEKARKISKIENHSIFYKQWALVGKAAKGILGFYFGSDDKSLSEGEIQKFRDRMRKLIDQGNPEAKNMLARFEDAVADGNWRKAREIMGKHDSGIYGNSLKAIANWGNDKVHELDNKDTDKSDTAKRYRYILSKVEEALTKKHLKPYWGVLVDLRDDMRKLDLLELDEETLDEFQKRLQDVDKTAGVFDKADIEAYDTQHREKMKVIQRKQALLSEISAAQDRCGLFDGSKRRELRRLFQEVDLLSLEELDDDVLDGYDEELRTIDSKAMSTKQFSPEEQKEINEKLKKSNALLNDIERARAELGFWDFGPKRRLNELQQDIESMPIEHRDDDLFESWTERLQEVNPHLLGANDYDPEEMKEIFARRRKADVLADAIEEYNGTLSWINPMNWSKKNTMRRMINEIRGTADDKLSDKMIETWEDQYKDFAGDKAKDIDAEIEKQDKQKDLMRRRDKIVKAAKRARQGAKNAKDNKAVKKLDDLIEELESLSGDELSEKTLNSLEQALNDIIKGTKYEEATKNILNKADKNMADAKAKVAAEKNKPTTLTAGNVNAYRKGMNADNLIAPNPVLTSIQNRDAAANKAFAQAAAKAKVDFKVEEKSKFDQATGKRIMLFTVNDGPWFSVVDLRKQSIYNQLAVLAYRVSITGNKVAQQHENDLNADAAYDKLHDQITDLMLSGKATENDLAKLEQEAAKLGVEPYSNPTLYGFQLLTYDPSLDKQGANAVTAAASKVSGGVKNAWGKVTGLFSRGKNAVANGISNIKDNITGTASKLSDAIKGKVIDFKNAGLDWFSNKRSWLADKYHAAMNYIPGKFDDVKDGVANATSNVVDLAKKGVQTYLNAGKNLRGSILNGVSNIGDMMQSEANDLMKSLIADNKAGNGEISGALDTNAQLLNVICTKLDNVVDAILEHNGVTNEKIGVTAQQSYDLMKATMNQKLKKLNTKVPPLFKPPTISIAK